MKRRYLLVLLMPLLSFSCAILDHDADRPVLGDIKWTLSAIEEKKYNLGDKTILEFDIRERTAKGKAACNDFSAEYEPLTDNRISFSEIISTKMYCEGVMDIEHQILTNLSKVKRYEIKADKLYMYGDAQLLLTFKR